jgi:hypothetical protein
MTETSQLDPYQSDPDRWGTSLAQVQEIMRPVLDAAGAKSIVEVGAFAGDLTRVLVQWAAGAGAKVGAVDPSPQPGLVKLAEENPEVELIRETSLEALPHIDLPDAFVIDGDHNYWTVSEELRLIAERAGDSLPLLLFHDVCWPHARRDDYFAADLIPEDYRQPIANGGGGIFPGEPGLRPDGGLPYPRSAVNEGGPRNGVLTAVEDFVAARDDLRLVVVPAFFGFGVVWPLTASYSDDLARILDPYDRNPVLERLEANRVHHLALGQTRAAEIWKYQERLARQEAVLRRLLDSSAFVVAERLSQVRDRAGIGTEHSTVSKEEIRRALEG